MPIFNHSMFRFCFIYLLPQRKLIDSFHFQPFFPQNLSFPAFSIYSQSLEYELITGDQSNCLKSNNYWTVFNNFIYNVSKLRLKSFICENVLNFSTIEKYRNFFIGNIVKR